jgi:hypothetical protein
MEKISINGPYNYFKITNGEKTICLFSDVHYNLDNQTECSLKKDSIDIDQFLNDFLINSNKSDKKYDLFIESEYMWINNKISNPNYRGIYLDRIRKLFEINMNFDLSNNKIIKSNSYQNARFHYFDFRFTTIPEFNTLSNLNLPSYPPYDSQIKLSSILYYIDIIKKEHSSYKNNIKDNKYKYIYKTLNNYSDKKIKEKIQFISDNHYIKIINDILDLCDEIKDEINEKQIILTNKYTNNKIKFELSIEIYKKITFIQTNLSLPFLYTDLYLIRRILDKKYINNCIIYTGGHHVINIIFLLVKYFNFKIIDCFYNDNNYNIKKINNIFLKAEQLHNILYIFDNFESQCIEINKNIF